MKKQFDPLALVIKLSRLGERQGKTAARAAALIKNILKNLSITYRVELHTAYLPKVISARLTADGSAISCRATSFVSGSVHGSENIVSSLIPSRFLIDRENINFNPLCHGISRSNFYFAPAVAVYSRDLPRIISAKRVQAKVRIKKCQTTVEQILVGNTRNPHNIVFAHYDSIGPGATDNASGVSVVLGALVQYQSSLSNTLFVFDGNEELSFDTPTYWGKGFRIFEANHKSLLEAARRIIVVDCVGNGLPHYGRDKAISYLAFPVENVNRWSGKIFHLSGDIKKLMQVYHSDLDTPRVLRKRFLDAAIKLLSKKLLG